jgi:D-glycero-D-manno-heptose 1,7-bisphosphate phosphatase
MLLDLIQHWPVREEQSFLVGDKRSDIEAAERINMPAYRFEGGNLDIATADYLRDRSPWPQG